MAETINLIFSYSFKHKIWKTVPDESTPGLAIELRDDHSLNINFYYFSFSEAKLVELAVPDTDWWTALAGAANERIYLKQFESEGNPELREWIVWDVKQQKKVTPVSLSETSFAYTTENKVALYPRSDKHFETLKKFIQLVTRQKVSDAAIEYLEFKNYVIISYYIQKGNLENYLLVVDESRKIVFHQCLASDLKGIGQETFSVMNNKLIFVKDKQQIFIYQFD